MGKLPLYTVGICHLGSTTDIETVRGIPGRNSSKLNSIKKITMMAQEDYHFLVLLH